MKQFFCPYCKDWQDENQCTTHFIVAHQQDSITFEQLSTRLSCLGGLETRDTAVIDSGESFWGWMAGAK